MDVFMMPRNASAKCELRREVKTNDNGCTDINEHVQANGHIRLPQAVFAQINQKLKDKAITCNRNLRNKRKKEESPTEKNPKRFNSEVKVRAMKLFEDALDIMPSKKGAIEEEERKELTFRAQSDTN